MDDGVKNYLIGNAVMDNAAHEMRRTRTTSGSQS